MSTVKKTLIGMVLGFVISQILITALFTAGNGIQPQNIGSVRHNFLVFLASVRDSFKQSPDKRSGGERMRVMTGAKNLPSRAVVRGVYAAEDRVNAASYTRYEYQLIQWSTETLTLPDGRIVTVRYPAGQSPPSYRSFGD